MQVVIKTDYPQLLSDYANREGLEVADTGNNGAKIVYIYETDKNRLAAIMAKLADFK